MPDPRPCCVLGVCCPPGGKAQRKAMREWLVDKLGSLGQNLLKANHEEMVDHWLDELPWEDDK